MIYFFYFLLYIFFSLSFLIVKKNIFYKTFYGVNECSGAKRTRSSLLAAFLWPIMYYSTRNDAVYEYIIYKHCWVYDLDWGVVVKAISFDILFLLLSPISWVFIFFDFFIVSPFRKIDKKINKNYYKTYQ